MSMLKNANGQTLAEFLADYDENKYRRPSVTVDMAVFTLIRSQEKLQPAVLLIRRKDHPYIGQWALPGGFINMDEELRDAAARELMEETGVSAALLRPFGAFGALNRDPRTRIITCGYFAAVPMGCLAPTAGDDAADARLFCVNAAMEAYSHPAERYAVTLKGEAATLTPRATLRYDELGSQAEMAVPLGKGALGGDHDLLLFKALLELNRIPRRRLARWLVRDCPHMLDEAIEALSGALGALPRRA